MSNKGKKKYWRCGHFEYEYDDLGKYCYCHSKSNPNQYCQAKTIYQMKVCPYFKKGNESFFLKCGDNLAETKKFMETMEKERREIEIMELNELKRLKEKYEK